MELKQLTAKKIRVGAKNGMTMEDFCAKYNCSVEQFSAQVLNLYRGDMKATSQIINHIEANAKRAKPKSVISRVDESEMLELYEVSRLGIADAPNELERLRGREDALTQEIANLETLYGSLRKRHDDYLGQLAELETAYNKLREELITKGNKFDKLAGLINESKESIDDLIASWNQKSLALDEVREKIASLTVVRLEVTEDGKISAPGNAEFSFNEIGSDEWYRELIQDEDTIGNLRLRDVRVLARVLAIVENASTEGYPEVEVEFEVPELAEVYDSLK